MPIRCLATLICVLLAGAGDAARAARPDPWLDGVNDLVLGQFAGFGVERMPAVVLGPPQGRGALAGSTDVVSLGHGGSIVVVFRDNVVVDGPGDDLVIYENAFHSGSEDGPIFTEYATVEVSADGKAWVEFPWNAETGEGLAGATPVMANSTNGIDPLAPEGGGDRFDLAAVGLQFARFVRIVDGGDAIDDAGNHVPPGDKGGFDLDAAGAIHWSPPGVVAGMVRNAEDVVPRARVTLIPHDGTRRLHKRSRANGRFRFRPVLPSGGYTLRVRRKGIGRTRREIAVDLGMLRVEVEVDLSLSEGAGLRLRHQSR